jgi:ribosomal protein S27AE
MFYKHSGMSDGHLNKCKSCAKSDASKHRNENIDYYLEYDRQRANLPKRVEARSIYGKTEAGKNALRRAKKKWESANIIKRAASIIIRNAVRDGKLSKPSECAVCSKTGRIHGHHDDYAQPLKVRWLCSKCHSEWHKIHGEGANAH